MIAHYVYIYIYIYIYIYRYISLSLYMYICISEDARRPVLLTSLDFRGLDSSGVLILRVKILDFRGFDSSNILILRGNIIMSVGSFLESLSQGILVGMILVGRWGVFIVKSMCMCIYIYIYTYTHIHI